MTTLELQIADSSYVIERICAEAICLERLPPMIEVARSGFAFYGSFADDPVHKHYKKAVDVWANKMAAFLNGYSCLRFVSRSALAFLIWICCCHCLPRRLLTEFAWLAAGESD